MKPGRLALLFLALVLLTACGGRRRAPPAVPLASLLTEDVAAQKEVRKCSAEG